VSLTHDAPKCAQKSPGGPPLPPAESESYGGSVGGFLVKEIPKDTVTLEGADGSRQKLFLGR
jgi:hypothetical protein